MNSYAFVFLAALACANAGLLAAPAAQILQGPSSSATIIGPDGSAISSIAPGGRIAAGLIAAPAPALLAAPALARSALIAPQLLGAPGLLARSSLLGNTIIAGPSGTISTSGPLAAPIGTVALL